MTSEELIVEFEQACQEFVQVVDSLSESQFESPLRGWSAHAIAAHLAGWNGLMIEAAHSILAGEQPAYYADGPNDFGTINRDFVDRRAVSRQQDLLDELVASGRAFVSFVRSLPGEDLEDAHGVRHYRGTPATVAGLVRSLAGDYRGHTAELREWLDEKG
jgi:hypothetical protein